MATMKFDTSATERLAQSSAKPVGGGIGVVGSNYSLMAPFASQQPTGNVGAAAQKINDDAGKQTSTGVGDKDSKSTPWYVWAIAAVVVYFVFVRY